MRPSLERQGFRCTLLANPSDQGGPFLIAERMEDAALPTVLSYGHGDVIRGQEGEWRAALNFDLSVDLREGGHHSGNWGGLLRNPGIVLAHAIASITDANGAIRVPEWRPDS